MRNVALPLLAAMAFLAAARADPKTLADYRAIYDTETAKIETAHRERLKGITGKYGRDLGVIRGQYTKKGELDAVLASKREQARFEEEQDVPNSSPPGTPALIQEAQSLYRSAVAEAETLRAGLLGKLTRSYLKRLDALKKDLVVRDKLDEAVAVESEITRVEFVLADIESKLPAPAPKPKVAQHRPSVPQPETPRIPANLAAGLVLHFDFDEDEGKTVTDRSGKGNHGKVYGAKWTKNGVGARQTARGWVGGARRFDGKDDYASAASSASLQMEQAITLSAWVLREADNNTYERIVSKSDISEPDYWLQVSRDGTIGGGIKSPTPADRRVCRHHRYVCHTPSETEISLGSWTHLVVTYDGGSTVGYVNGRVDKRQSGTGRITVSDRPFNVGRHCGRGRWEHGFTGVIDEAMVWNRALSEAEVKQLHELQKGGGSP